MSYCQNCANREKEVESLKSLVGRMKNYIEMTSVIDISTETEDREDYKLISEASQVLDEGE